MENIKSGNKGQSLVETALILPVIILILTGIIDFGLLFNNYLVMQNASREGARIAAIGSTDSQIITAVINSASSLDQTKMKIVITPTQVNRKNGDEVTVSVEYDNTLLTPIISAIIPNPIHLTTKSIMRVE